MNKLILTILIGISLSMDSFSLSFSYGTLNISKKNRLILSSIVGLFHFFMPLFGLFVGGIITKYLIFDLNILLSIIIIIIGVSMIISSFKKEESSFLISIPSFILFGFSVSIDSFSTGIGLNSINDNYLQVSLIFSFCSFLFTYIGLVLGTKLSEIIGKYAEVIGGVVLIILGIYYL